ncbi:MAG: M67 family metallopeptidase [Anaerolineales bacterium]|nr:M67 family metallopeptidase [Anaerolineales bacterium]
MALYISSELMQQIQAHGEAAYPEEGAGLLLGIARQADRHVFDLQVFDNAREDGARHNRYLLTSQDYLAGELEAARLGLSVIGVFHSHPDHPDRPSEFDREWAMPWFSYIITSVQSGRAVSSRSWHLKEDRSQFEEELIQITDGTLAQLSDDKQAR